MTVQHDLDDRDVSLLAYDQYMREVRHITRRTVQEEKQLLLRIERGRLEQQKPFPNQWLLSLAKHARDEMVESYQPLIIHASSRYVRVCRGMERLDFIQEGNLGLFEAFDTYDASSGCSFLMHAISLVRFAMLRGMRERNGIIRIAAKTQFHLTALERFERRFLEEYGRFPLVSELASGIELREFQVYDLLSLRSFGRVESLEAVASSKTEDGDEDFVNFVSLFEQEIAYENARRRELQHAVHQALEEALSPKRRKIVRLLYGFEDGRCWTRDEIAESFGVRRHSVDDAYRVAREKLRTFLSASFVMAHELRVA